MSTPIDNISYNNNTNPVQQNLQGPQTDPNEINNIMNGLENASKQGATSLPVAKVPIISSQIQQDVEAVPNYVPKKQVKFEDNMQYLDEYLEKEKRHDTPNKIIDDVYQIPILLAVLFFVFTMPIINKSINNHFPSLFSKDGDILLGGNLFKSILFGFSYYMANKGINYLNEL